MITEEYRRMMEYEEMFTSLMTKARTVYLARTVAEERYNANKRRIDDLLGCRSFFGKRKRQKEVESLRSENAQIEYGFEKSDTILAAMIAELDRMEPNLGERAVLYARDPDGRWLRRQ